MSVLVQVTAIRGEPPHGRASVHLRQDDWEQESRTSRRWQWQHTFEALRLEAGARLTISLHSDGQQLAKRKIGLRKLCGHAEWPSDSQSDLEKTIQLGDAAVTCRFQITWPPDLAALSSAEKQRWAKGADKALSASADLDAGLDAAARKLAALGCHEVFWQDLQSLIGWDIVLICDDSGSMSTRTENGTRWQELKRSVELLVNLCCALDSDGIDVLFLNRRGKHNVTSMAQVADLFKAEPSGSTPLAKALSEALGRKTEKPMLVILATDGVPDSMERFVAALEARPDDVYVSLLACSDNDDEVGYLNALDDRLPRLDVLDDYHSERREVQRVQGNVDYTLGDHCARMLLGAVFDKYDKLDEVRFA